MNEEFTSAFPLMLAGGIEFLASQDSSQPQAPRALVNASGSDCLPRIDQDAVTSIFQVQVTNLPSVQGYTPAPVLNRKPIHRRRQKRTLEVIHPAVLPIELVMDQEVFELVDTAHFEHRPTSIPRIRTTSGRNSGFYKASSYQDESTDDDSDDSADEWTPSRA